MPYESGGRADKLGNRYEFNWIVLKIIDIVAEEIDAIKIEPIGEEEHGVDIWIRYKDGKKEAQQCKGRNGSKEYWTLSDLNQKGILKNWKEHLERDSTNTVSLVSPLPFTNLSDLIYRAQTNDDNQSFIKFQVENSSEMKKLLSNYVQYLELSVEEDIAKIIDFLIRTKIRSEPYPEDEKFIEDKIRQYFIGDASGIKSKFINWILEGEIFGKWITIKALDSFIQKEKIELRNLACDSRIMPRIQCLNNEYKNRFKALQYGLTIRTQLNQCVNYIQNGKSIIIHGKAGNGKSGLTENIINWCDENNILHLDLKLDSHIPYGSAQKWGEELGFPTSISHCIDAFSKDNSAVLILDQLDALRWTAKNSKNSISTCLELIREVQNINLERENKISIVLVCRTYDLENDSGIKSIFEQKSDYWYKIKVDEFSEGEVQKILGNKYQKYPNRLKQLLKTPSNLYVWEKFDNEAEYYQISSTYNLVDNWWRDLSEKCQDVMLSEESLNDLKLQLVKLFNDTGKAIFSKRRIEGNEKAIRYLISKGMLIERSNDISFVHQSFLDCFVAEQMVRDYYKNSDIVSIIGQKNKQTPTRRYQLQLFLQILQEDSEGDFLDFGEKLLNNNGIRFNFKYVFLEILGSIQKPSKRVLKYIGTLIQNIIWRKHLCNTVVRGCSSYVNYLAKEKILQKWINEDKALVIDLLSSISPNYDSESINLIRNLFSISDNKFELRGCFFSDYHNDSEEFFRLRLCYWQSNSAELDYPDDFYKNINEYTIRVIQLMLDNLQDDGRYNKFYSLTGDFDHKSKEYISENYIYIVDTLLPHIHKFSKINSKRYNFALKERSNIQKYYLNLLHEANKNLLSKEPKLFFEKYQEYMEKGDFLYNEVVLDALYYLPSNYSDKCVKYLLSDFNKTLFERSEGYERKLVLAKRLIKKVSIYCSKNVYSKLESDIIHYNSPDAVIRLKGRIEENSKNRIRVFWPFWGELQFRLLSVLPKNRMSKEAQDLLQVLKRSNYFLDTFFETCSGSVISPLQGKRISLKSWKKILISDKKGKTGNWDSKRKVFVESRPEDLSRDFRRIVSQEPRKYIDLFLKLAPNYNINKSYINALLGGIADLDGISIDILKNVEFLLLNYVDDSNQENLYQFFQILQNNPHINWSKEIFNKLDCFLKSKKIGEFDTPKDFKSVEDYIRHSYTTTRGYALHALDELIIKNPMILSSYRETIIFLAKEGSNYDKLNLIFLISTILDIDKSFAQELFKLIFNEDERVIGHWKSGYILYEMCDKYKERVESLLLLGFNSKDSLLVKKSSQLLAELYFNKGYFESIVYSGIELQASSICEMAIKYFKNKNIKKKAKELILHYLNSKDTNLESILPQIFSDDLLDIIEDRDFVFQLFASKYKNKIYYHFCLFLEKQPEISCYEDIIFEMISKISSDVTFYQIEPYYHCRKIEEVLSRSMLSLYDEHKEDEISERCLDIIDKMFENEFGNARILIDELMQK